MSVKGAKEFEKFKQNKPLTRKQALLAQCYECNGYSMEDCKGLSCPLYQWSPCNKSAKYHPLKPIRNASKKQILSRFKKKDGK